MRKIVLLLTLFLFISSISALCNEGQIDVNSASAEELDKLSGIGPAKAQEIINSRPFNSLDDLIRVKGIGNITLSNIKTQGIACVDSDTENTKEDNNKNVSENKSNQIINEIKKNITNTDLQENKGVSQKNIIQAEVINLNPKDIKSEDDSEKTKGNYAIYGFIAFSILIVVLFMLRKNRYKNEFR